MKLSNDAGEYLTSDPPVQIWSLDRDNTAFNPDAAMKLPLGPKHMLWLMPCTLDVLKNRITRWHLTGEQAKSERIAASILQHHNAERWLLGSPAALQQHVHERTTLQHDLDHPPAGTTG